MDISTINNEIDTKAKYLQNAHLILKSDSTFQIINSRFFYYIPIPGWEILANTLSGKWFLKGKTLFLNVSDNFSFSYQIVKLNRNQLIFKEKDAGGIGLTREILLKKE